MQVMFGNNRHVLTVSNTLVVVYEQSAWSYMGHVIHTCTNDCPDRTEDGTQIRAFEPKLIAMCREQHFNILMQWEPDEGDHYAWEMSRQNAPVSEEEIARASEATDDDLFDEMEGWADE